MGKHKGPKKVELLAKHISKESIIQKYIIEDLDRKDVAEYFNLTRYELIALLNYYNIRIPLSQKMRKTRARQLANMTSERKAEIKAKEMETKAKKSAEELAEETARRLATKAKNEALDPEKYARNRQLGYEKRSENLKLKTQEFWDERNRKLRATLEKQNFAHVKKGIETKKLNKSFKSSSIQDRLADYLKIMYPDTEVEYNKDPRYPFNCDFYIPQFDLFIELNGHWTHGPHPFDPENESDQLILKRWKSKCSTYTSKTGKEKPNSYHNAIKVWTELDPLKLKYARDNKLNYVAFYNIKTFSAMNVMQHIDFNKMRGIYLWDIYEDYKIVGDYL